MILFLDDEEDFGELLVEIFSLENGPPLKYFSGPVEGLEFFSSHRDEIKLVISDLSMAEMGGVEVAIKSREINPEVPCWIYSGQVAPEVEEELKKEGVKKILTKPVDPIELLAMVKETTGL